MENASLHFLSCRGLLLQCINWRRREFFLELFLFPILELVLHQNLSQDPMGEKERGGAHHSTYHSLSFDSLLLSPATHLLLLLLLPIYLLLFRVPR